MTTPSIVQQATSTNLAQSSLEARLLPSHVRTIEKASDFLSELTQPNINMAILDEAPSAELASLAASIRSSSEEIQFRGRQTRESLTEELPRFLASKESLTDGDRQYLFARALASFDLYHSLTGEKNPQVVISKVDERWLTIDPRNAVAQSFHYESGVPLNLVSTLVGRGTEYVANDNIRRDLLYRSAQSGRPLADEELLINPAARFLMPTGATVIFKGELIGFPGERGSSPFLRRFNQEMGLVHRGVPLEPGEVRLRLNVYSTRLPAFIKGM